MIPIYVYIMWDLGISRWFDASILSIIPLVPTRLGGEAIEKDLILSNAMNIPLLAISLHCFLAFLEFYKFVSVTYSNSDVFQ